MYLLCISVNIAISEERNIALVENRIQIALLDTGISIQDYKIKPFLCNKVYDMTNSSVEDWHGHGTHLAHILASFIDSKKHCILIIKVFNRRHEYGVGGVDSILKGIRNSIDNHVRYINLSFGGTEKSIDEEKLIREALDKNIRVSVAAGNEGRDFNKLSCNYYPACYNIKSNNFYVVGSIDSNGKVTSFSNYHGPIDAYEKGEIEIDGISGRGTSISTIIWTGKLLRKENP